METLVDQKYNHHQHKLNIYTRKQSTSSHGITRGQLGKGQNLGDSRREAENTPEEAARHRILPERINQEAAERGKGQVDNQSKRKPTIKPT